MEEKSVVGVVKFIIGIVLSNLIRLLRFIPNNDPIMAITLPFSKQKKFTKQFFFRY
jgi:hypothetical protein